MAGSHVNKNPAEGSTAVDEDAFDLDVAARFVGAGDFDLGLPAAFLLVVAFVFRGGILVSSFPLQQATALEDRRTEYYFLLRTAVIIFKKSLSCAVSTCSYALRCCTV